jgi:signal transduction histidine kinase
MICLNHRREPMDPHQQQQARIDFLERENSALEKELSTCKRLVTNLTRFAVMNTIALRHWADEKRIARQLELKLLQSRKKLQRLSRRTLETLENDRQKMARELHDGIGASLSAIKFIVEEKQTRIEKREFETDLSLKPIILHLTDTIKATKSIAARLRPATLDDLGLRATLSWFCREFAACHEGIRIEHRIDVSETDIPEEYKIVIYRIVQEAMTNAAEHARPTLIRIAIVKTNESIRVTVEDDGLGFDPRGVLLSTDPPNRYGLQSMHGRTEICGGTFKIDSHAGLGTRIRVCLPLQRGGAMPHQDNDN